MSLGTSDWYSSFGQTSLGRSYQGLIDCVCWSKENNAAETHMIDMKLSGPDKTSGTLAIYGRGEQTEEEKKLLNPKGYLEPPTDCFWALPTIVRPTDASYAETLKTYWWYHLPSKAELAKRQKFVPSEHVGPSPMGGIDFIKEK